MATYETPFETYDLVYGVTQNALNANLKYIFGQFADDEAWFKIGDVWSDDSEDDAALYAKMAPPRLDFIYGSATQARVTITFDQDFRPTVDDLLDAQDCEEPNALAVNVFAILGGSRRRPQVECYDCTNWRLVFDVDLNYAEYDPADPRTPGSIKAKLTAFTSEMFSVQQIFLDLTNVNTLSVSPKTYIDLPVSSDLSPEEQEKRFMKIAKVMLEAQKIVAQTLTAKQQSKQDKSLFTLAFAVAKKKEYPPALFEPTGTVHSTKKFTDSEGNPTNNEGQRGLATLNFLLNTDNRPVERRVQTYGVFDSKNLVTNPLSHGTAIITRKQLDKKFIRNFWDAIMSVLARDMTDLPFGGDRRSYADPDHGLPDNYIVQKTPEGGTWELTYGLCIRGDDGDNDVNFYMDAREFKLERKNHADDIELVGTGKISLEIKREYFDDLFDSYQGKVWKTATSDIKFSVRLTAGADGKVVITPGLPNGQAFEIGEPVTDDDKTGAVAFVDEIGLWDSDGLLDAMMGRLNTIKSNIDNAIDQKLAAEFNSLESKIIFPAPGVFFYSRMQFSEHGDLELEVAYKS